MDAVAPSRGPRPPAAPSCILVTSASGLVGGAAHAALARAAPPGRRVLRASSRGGAPGGDTHNTRLLDMLRPETWPSALAGADALLLVRPPALADVRRVFAPLVAACASAGVAHVVLLSIDGAEAMPWAPHRRIELCLERSGLACTFVRAAYFDQNLLTEFGREIREERRVTLPAGDLMVSGWVARGGSVSACDRRLFVKSNWVDARDVGELCASALLSPPPPGAPPRAWLAAGPENLAFSEVCGRLSAALARARPDGGQATAGGGGRTEQAAARGGGAPAGPGPSGGGAGPTGRSTDIQYRPVGALHYCYIMRRRGTPWAKLLVMLLLHWAPRLRLRGGPPPALSDNIALHLGRPPRRLDDFLAEHREAWL